MPSSGVAALSQKSEMAVPKEPPLSHPGREPSAEGWLAAGLGDLGENIQKRVGRRAADVLASLRLNQAGKTL